jgi:SNF2 family DNA or RNA helicase
MIFIPRPWQKPMIDAIVSTRRLNLWAPMGSGKTSAVLTAFHTLDLCGSNFFPVLVIAPLRVARDVWTQEGQEWDHLKGMKIVPIIGDVSERRRAIHTKADVYTINYENIPWLVEEWGDKWPYLSIVADESTKLKGFRLRVGTKRAAALAQISRKTQRWINLTGTPSPNGLQDLWGQNWFVDYGQRLFRTWTDFKHELFDYNEWTRELSPKKHTQGFIQEKLSDVTLTVDLSDYMKIEKPVSIPVYVRLSEKLMAQYRQLEEELFVSLSENVQLIALTGAAKTTKCLQFCAGAAYHEDGKWTEIHDLKLDALESIIEETAGANLLVAYWWKHDLDRLKKRFSKIRELKTKKDENDWNAGKIHLMAVHPMSVGHGLSLQHGGHHIVRFSSWWNLELHQQILERIGPIRQMQSGYDRLVYDYNIIIKDTVDEDVKDRHATKKETQDILMDAMNKRRKK